MRLNLRTLIASVAALLLIAGCTLPYRTPQLSPEGADFPGINDALVQSATVDVVLVHGMCTHDLTWVSATNTALARELGMSFDSSDGVAIPIGTDAAANPTGATGLLVEHHLKGNGRTVNTFAILWSPISDAAKSRLCYDVSDGNKTCPAAGDTNTGKRDWVNRYFKENLLDNCLADAVYYAGTPGRTALQSAIREGISVTLFGDPHDLCGDSLARDKATRAGGAPPLIFITESLGSKMLYDTLVNTANSCRQAHPEFDRALKRPMEVFMAANQLPILSLADTPRLSTETGEPAGTAQAPAAVAAQSALGPVLDTLSLSGPGGVPTAAERGRMQPPNGAPVIAPKWVVAFSDPNDLLSYTLRAFECPLGSNCTVTGGVRFADVLVSNDWSYVRTAERPDTAHTTYLNRTAAGVGQSVERLIACGGAAYTSGCHPPDKP